MEQKVSRAEGTRAARPLWRSPIVLGAVVALSVTGVVGAAPAYAAPLSATLTDYSQFGGYGWGGGYAPVDPAWRSGSIPGSDTGTSSSSDSSNASDGPSDAAAIARKVDAGVVDVVATLSDGEAAGTGMVLTSSGEVLTNNHVIDGATSISVRDVGNGRTYSATVVGYDRTADVAVLQLKGASNLSTVRIGSSAPGTGAAVVAVGNAGGTGGTPSYAGGAIVATGQSITASDTSGGSSEQLTGLLETDANIQPGDSGGPLVNTDGRVVGMDTAAGTAYSVTPAGYGTSTSQGYAIPIASALSIARQIEAGQASSTVHIGATAVLGVYVVPDTGSDASYGYGYGYGGFTQAPTGAQISGVVQDGPAAAAGLAAGDTIVSVDGHTVSSASDLSDVMTQLRAGATVPVGYVNADGHQATTQVTLGTGAAK